MKYLQGMLVGGWLVFEAGCFLGVDGTNDGVMPAGEMVGIMGFIGGAIVLALVWKLIGYWQGESK